MTTAVDCPASDAAAGLAVLGDAAALIDCVDRRLCWTSPAWQRMQPGLPEGTSLEATARVLEEASTPLPQG